MTISVAHTIDKDMEHSSQPNTSQTSTVPADGCFKKNLITPDDNICSITKDKEMEHSPQTIIADQQPAGQHLQDISDALADVCGKYDRTYRTMLGPEPGQERRLMKIHDFSLNGVPAGSACQLFPPDLYFRYPKTESQTTEEMFKTLPEMMDKPMARCSRLHHSYWEDWFPAGAYQMVTICIGGEHATHVVNGSQEEGGKIPSKWEDRVRLLNVVADLLTTPIEIIADAFAPDWAIHSEFFSNIEVLRTGEIANTIYMTAPSVIHYVSFV